MPHYICSGGCGAVSDHPGICQANVCEKHDQPFTECDCIDKDHLDKLEKKEEGKSEVE